MIDARKMAGARIMTHLLTDQKKYAKGSVDYLACEQRIEDVYLLAGPQKTIPLDFCEKVADRVARSMVLNAGYRSLNFHLQYNLLRERVYSEMVAEISQLRKDMES